MRRARPTAICSAPADAPRADSTKEPPMLTLAWFVAVFAGALALAYINASGIAWSAALAVALAVAWTTHALPPRLMLISDAVLAGFRKVLPPMSQTEREAIEAGTVWWDGELFSGRPDWKKLLAVRKPSLTPEERRFLEHETEELCALITDWETTNVHRDLPPRVWQFIKDKGFWGMAIAKEYGGLGFSAYAH